MQVASGRVSSRKEDGGASPVDAAFWKKLTFQNAVIRRGLPVLGVVFTLTRLIPPSCDAINIFNSVPSSVPSSVPAAFSKEHPECPTSPSQVFPVSDKFSLEAVPCPPNGEFFVLVTNKSPGSPSQTMVSNSYADSTDAQNGTINLSVDESVYNPGTIVSFSVLGGVIISAKEKSSMISKVDTNYVGRLQKIKAETAGYTKKGPLGLRRQ